MGFMQWWKRLGARTTAELAINEYWQDILDSSREQRRAAVQEIGQDDPLVAREIERILSARRLL